MGVQGFPTLKIVKPAKKAGGRPVVEDYQGPRTARAIVEAVRDKMPMHVTRLKDAGLSEWLSIEGSKPKTLVFSDKGVVSPLVKALAIDFLGSIDFALVKSSEKAAVEQFGVMSFPSVVLVPGGDKRPITFDGELKKATLIEFLSQVAAPNPAPPLVEPRKAKDPKKKEPRKSTVKSASRKPSQASETLEPESKPTESPSPKVADEQAPPVQLPVKTPPRIASLASADALQKSCLHTKASTCILAILPDSGGALEDSAASPAQLALSSLGEIAHKHARRGVKIFPFYGVPSSNAGGATLLTTLEVAGAADQVQIIAINAKRSWWKQFGGEDFSTAALERWIDAIRYDEVKKEKLPRGIVKELQEETQAKKPQPVPEPMQMLFDLPSDSPLQVELLEVIEDDDWVDSPYNGPLKMDVVEEIQDEPDHDEL